MRVLAVILSFLVVGRLAAAPVDDWLDRYSQIMRAEVVAAREYVHSRDPALDGVLDDYDRLMESTLTLSGYLLRYYLANDPSQLKWNDGSWTDGILPCFCGEHGSIPTDEFRTLFAKWQKDIAPLEARDGTPPFKRFQEILNERGNEGLTSKLAPIMEEFEEMKKKPNQALQTTPVTRSEI